jgi:CII-binding regulator of phage lambda lysogenization HflD
MVAQTAQLTLMPEMAYHQFNGVSQQMRNAMLSARCSAYLAQLLRGTSWSLVFCMEELGDQPS